jgi:hypothetical protein
MFKDIADVGGLAVNDDGEDGVGIIVGVDEGNKGEEKVEDENEDIEEDDDDREEIDVDEDEGE